MVFNTFEYEFPERRIHLSESSSASYSDHKMLFLDQTRQSSPSFRHAITLDLDEVQRSFDGSKIHAAIVETLVGLLYSLSNQSLTDTGRETLTAITEAPTWDTVFPHLRDVLTEIDSNMIQAIAEGLLKESVRTCHHRLLDAALGLGADPKHRLRHLDRHERRHVLLTPLVSLCRQHSLIRKHETRTLSTERMIRSLIKADTYVHDRTLFWVIRASFHAIAKDVIGSQPERAIDSAIPIKDLEGGSSLGLDTYESVTLLLVACSDPRPSAEKHSLIRCLLERNAKADLKVMIAATGTCDEEVISLLHQHGAPVNGCISGLGSPLSSACKSVFRSPSYQCTGLAAIPLLLGLGACPDSPMKSELDSWELSPLHILALAEEQPTVTAALQLLLDHGVDMNCRARLHGSRSLKVSIGPYGPMAETALEYAIEMSRWNSAVQLLSADCELTGREILFISSDSHTNPQIKVPKAVEQERFTNFIGALLEKAPEQVTVLHWSGLTVLQRAIQYEHEDMIQALLAFGVTPLPSDLMYMLCNGMTDPETAEVCRMSENIQLTLALAASAELSERLATDVETLRLILAFACPQVVRYLLNIYAGVYDSEGLCSVIARIVSKDKVSYFFTFYLDDNDKDEEPDSLDIDDLRMFISRRNTSNRDENWESTAVTLAARAGRVDILQIIIGSGSQGNDGMIPLFLLKEVLIPDMDSICESNSKIHEWNTARLGAWIRYCRMDNPNTRCSPLTAAAMVLPGSAAEEMVHQLLALKYQPDGWTVLVASCQGHLLILQLLQQLEYWPHILNHESRPDWCPTALQAALYSGHVDIVRFLLHSGTRMDTMDLSPCRPFCYSPDMAFEHQSRSILPRTALQHAVEKENMELVILLVSAGANVNAPAAMDSGATALQIASIQGSIPMVEYLISQGADPHAPGAEKRGRTALEAAAEHGRKDVVELLLVRGATTAPQHRKQIVQAIFYAEQNAHRVVAKILREELVPQFSSEEEAALEILADDWESSSETSVFRETQDNFRAWEASFEVTSESTETSDSGSSPAASSEEPDVENPIALPGNDLWLSQDMQADIEGHGAFDVPQVDEVDLWRGDVMSGLDFQEYSATWVDGEPSFEGYSAEDMLPDDFFFNIS